MAGDIGPESFTRFTSNKSSSHGTLSIFIAGERCTGLRTAILAAYHSFLHLDTSARRCLGLHRTTEHLYCWRAYLSPDQLTLHLTPYKSRAYQEEDDDDLVPLTKEAWASILELPRMCRKRRPMTPILADAPTQALCSLGHRLSSQ